MNSVPRPRSFHDIQEIKRQTGIPIGELLVLSADKDPFYAGNGVGREKAEWFAELWNNHCRLGDHIRGGHYTAFSIGFPKPDGRPYAHPPAGLSPDARRDYVNNDWSFLNDAAAAARYLKLIDPLAISDKRNRRPVGDVLRLGEAPEPTAQIGELSWSLPALGMWGLHSMHDLPHPEVTGYGYTSTDQPVFISLWIEKSTMDDTLLPLCDRLGIEYVAGTGYQSIHQIIQFIIRAARDGRPARILYISDWDPAGENMPVQVARQIEFWLPDFSSDCDIALQPLGLNEDQVRAWGLDDAIAPGKTRDIVELDAVKVLRPGLFEELITDTVMGYRDDSLRRRLAAVADEAGELARDEWVETTVQHRRIAEKLTVRARLIAAGYEERLAELAAELREEISPIQRRFEWLAEKVDEVREEFDPELPERPEAEIDWPDEDDFLYRSDRDYMEQLNAYRSYRGQDEAASAIQERTCGHCGATYETGSPLSRFCSPNCQANSSKLRRRGGPIQPRACLGCGVVWTPKRRDALCCSTRCNKMVARRKQAS